MIVMTNNPHPNFAILDQVCLRNKRIITIVASIIATFNSHDLVNKMTIDRINEIPNCTLGLILRFIRNFLHCLGMNLHDFMGILMNKSLIMTCKNTRHSLFTQLL